MDSGLILRGCTFARVERARKWVNPPGRPQLDAERKVMLDDAGKVIYAVDHREQGRAFALVHRGGRGDRGVREKHNARGSERREREKDTTGGRPQESRQC
jgi:hypothetical protein